MKTSEHLTFLANGKKGWSISKETGNSIDFLYKNKVTGMSIIMDDDITDNELNFARLVCKALDSNNLKPKGNK